jgi:hypothetical protein
MMTARTLLAAALAILAVPTVALGQGLRDENLLVGIPQGFESVYDAAQGEMEIHEFVPAGETVDDWTKMVTIQIFHGAGAYDGNDFALNLSDGWSGACSGGDVRKLTDGAVNGFPFVLWVYLCPRNPDTGKPENMYFKGISGSDAFYSVQYAFRSNPTADEDSVALNYLVSASACDTRRPDRPCPKGM